MITSKQSSDFILDSTKDTRVIPVLVVDDVSIAADLARTLVDAGMPVLEVTLRTPNALQVIEAMAKVDGAIVAAGTVLNEKHISQCKSAGAQFLVSPGHTDALIQCAAIEDMPLLPGAVTASEIMRLSDTGFHLLKFFPAAISGGVNALKAFSAPLPHVQFCPTGGVSEQNMGDYLSLPNVPVVGGSWMVTQQDLHDKNWKMISAKAQAVNL
ncbi:4-Hydroxy-2-oxoglutarate aldolase [gamma proteobacterium IMCC1989]|nr:4-Hydroxy-2-oxoglutarate aldolase [gamma proteobacterium IMCC1989]